MADSTGLKNGLASRGYTWLDQRFKIGALVDYMGHKVVPVHGHSIFYYLGGLTLFLFIVQVVTGILLLMTPSAVSLRKA